MAKVEQMVAIAQKIVTRAHHFLRVKENVNKRGGYFVVVNHQRAEFILAVKIGQVSKEKTEKYEVLAREKAWRLYGHIGNWTSFESRNEKAGVVVYDSIRPHCPAWTELWGQWGGAVRGNRYIFSFSGFPELLDEAMMFVLAIKMGELNREWVLERFGARNEYLAPFLAECSWTE
ncbi:hypothetical protein A3I99_01045 [Candidatus Kaiserbacteria bacterium RIFCSPLOWO2_02_FULL_45_11b]|uniref:Uncharacterized protein n=1 Tax=Candidatus Kaiserbacteria bacterium RIFCSPLOWO2_12_FULL_45_26 TaxID=1798525 RepID=A0A1F6FFL6_9BACT|nr:MAG: hypothetical protein A2929_02910 [Candidatus Kaiserbacteria bacterium RIFCSPLOWO2_01_FULL_45_25]OGG80908.1 MAG: hypothetical protein A3I99_01045 [Candidatus Kaiserbacteria bacterium RIFCSPLOWO2_02_FULL_45_11b]OGG84646.1 MAG: hypothetical protein A3G90_00990 [Candidatus Kaiserbacteria bacterium RIFCSPLOWO2_12_FULL_45_26]